MRVVASNDEGELCAVMHPELPLSEQLLSAAAAAAADSDVTAGVFSSSATEPISSRVMTMPHRLPAAMHAFHTPHRPRYDRVQYYYDIGLFMCARTDRMKPA